MASNSIIPKLESVAASQIEATKRRLDRLGIWSRSSAVLGLLLSTAADLTLLKSGAWQLTITCVHTVLLAIVLWTALRRDQQPATRPRSTSSTRRAVYLGGLTLLTCTALAQKWLIAAVPEATRGSYEGTYRVMAATVTIGGSVLALGRSHRLMRFFAAFAEQPARQMAVSFLALTVLGAFLLTLPVCVRSPSHVSFLDALFMATSAVCVTGLAVHSIALEYTAVGQGVLLGLVQVGGLGIMVLSASLVVLSGRKLRARSSAALAEMLDEESLTSLRGSIKRIVGFTLGIEAIGAAALYLTFLRHPQVAADFTADHPMAGSGSVLWAAIFHSVSAFCNAGFSLMRGGMEPFVSSYGVCSVIMVLIVLGGLGFPVMSELLHQASLRLSKRRPPRLTLHTRIVLRISAVLIVGVALLLAMVEWRGALAGLPWHERLWAALFQSVTLRTAGFNTVDFAAFTNAGLMIAMLFMFVGASPGGTGGGLKVTTFAVLFVTLRAELRGAQEPHLLDRRLPAGTVRRAISVAFVSVIVVTFSVLALLLSERADAMRLAFEAVSAFGTVGLSAGHTQELSSVGKLIIIVTMLIGRVGPLTVALATAERSERAHHARPRERVLIG